VGGEEGRLRGEVVRGWWRHDRGGLSRFGWT
jgi:hypothetical protein